MMNNSEIQKVTIERWLIQSTIYQEYRVVETSSIEEVEKLKRFVRVKLIESYEIEL